MGKKDIANLVAQWKWGTSIVENDNHFIEVLGLFDHDYEQHLLVLEYDKTLHQRGFSLWFLGVHTDASFVKSWENTDTPPFAEAGVIVQDWRELVAAHSDSWE